MNVSPSTTDEYPVKEYSLKPKIREYRKGNLFSTVLIVLLGLFGIFLELLFVALFQFTPLSAVLLGFVLIVAYIIFISLFEKDMLVREIRLIKIREIGSLPALPSAEALVHAAQEQSKNTTGEEFVGSTLTNTYHRATCGFAKSIKPAFRVTEKNVEFFKKNKFKPCAVCIGDEK